MKLVTVAEVPSTARDADADALRVAFAASPDDLRAEWSPLSLASRNIFATYEWVTVWQRHFGASKRLVTVSGRDASGQLVTVIPLSVSRKGPMRIARFAGYGPADQLGPVCRPADRAMAAGALVRALRGLPGGWDLFLGTQLAVDEGWAQLIGGPVLRRQSSPLIRSGVDGWDRHLIGEGSKRLRRKERAVAREHSLRYRLADDPDRLPQDLDHLFALHRLRWRAESPFSLSEAFHREFATVALERGWLRLWMLELDGEVVAAQYGMRYGGRESVYQFGRDPRLREASLGTLMLAHVVSSAFQEGVVEFSFLRGAEGYKYRLATSDPGLVTVALPHGPIGTIAVELTRAATRWKPRALAPLREKVRRFF